LFDDGANATAESTTNVPTADAGRIVLIEHGHTTWSEEGRHVGTTDLPLSQEGEAHSRPLQYILRRTDFGLILCSPQRQALRTAELAGFTESRIIDPNLREQDFGAFEGLTDEEIAANYGKPWNPWHDPALPGEPSGETSAQLRDRGAAVLRRIQPELQRGENVLLIAHSHILRSIATGWIDLPPSAGAAFRLCPLRVSELAFDAGHPVIAQWNSPTDEWFPREPRPVPQWYA
jgi:probable phosphoglycerate mutase